MRIQLALFASLSQYLPEADNGNRLSAHAQLIDLPDGSTVGQVIAALGLPDEPRIVFVNNRHAPESHVLQEGERLAVFPPVAGG
ncbi:MAG: MoaD/ThiS family protein [Coriobacteriia bacterium]|nr:MoaD/ThiS family protein [Coriobacteriia bacterium]MBN2821968.1 MoaD/ThiS family protein [Coriobacteriia bacterium]